MKWEKFPYGSNLFHVSKNSLFSVLYSLQKVIGILKHREQKKNKRLLFHFKFQYFELYSTGELSEK